MRKAFLFVLLIPWVVAACTPGQPQIVVERDQFDFGELVNGVVVTKELTVRNQGEAPLEIRGVSTSCGCTKASVGRNVIAPGEYTNLRIEYDSGAHGPELAGAITRQVFILSNDPGQPEVIVEFDSFVLPPESP